MKKIVLSAAVAALTFNSASFAATATGTANVNILDSLVITENTEVDFGDIAPVDGTCLMASDGSLSTTATGMSCTGTETAGSFTVTGSADAGVSFSVADSGTVDGVTFSPLIDVGLGGTGQSTSLTLSGGTSTVTVYGDLTLSSATPGAKTLSYTVTADYE